MSLSMGPFEMVVAIVVVAMAASVLREWIRHRNERVEQPGPEVLDELDALRQRVEALEEIVTDGREDLRRRFRDLERGR